MSIERKCALAIVAPHPGTTIQHELTTLCSPCAAEVGAKLLNLAHEAGSGQADIPSVVLFYLDRDVLDALNEVQRQVNRLASKPLLRPCLSCGEAPATVGNLCATCTAR